MQKNTTHKYKMKTFFGFVCLALGLLEIFSEKTETTYPNPIRVAIVEDHPWIFHNETCLKEDRCYCYGLLNDVLEKIQEDLKFNYTIEIYSEFGKLDNSSDPPKWTGVKGAVINKEVDMALVMLNVTDELKKVMEFSFPLVDNSKTNQTLALGFPKESTLTAGFSHMIHKLVNQRHIEQLKEMWFHDSIWSENQKSGEKDEKQLTRLD